MRGESTVKIPASVAAMRRGPKKLWHKKVTENKLMGKKSEIQTLTPLLPRSSCNTWILPTTWVIFGATLLGIWWRVSCDKFLHSPSVFSCLAAVKRRCLHNCWKGVRFVMNRYEHIRFCLTSPPCGTIRKTMIVTYKLQYKDQLQLWVFFQRILYFWLWKLKCC